MGTADPLPMQETVWLARRLQAATTTDSPRISLALGCEAN